MNMMHRHTACLRALAVSALLIGSSSAHAQAQRSGGGESQRIMQQYQQLAAEKTALQAQIAQLKKDLDTAHSDLAAMKKERDVLKAQAHTGVPAAAVAQLTAGKETAEKNLEQYKQRMTELVSRFRETAGNLKEVEADRTKVQKELGEKNTAFDKCAQNNLALYDINQEILDRYEHVGPFTKVSAGEPFTRITRTRLDNLVDEYRARAMELKVKKTGP
jgi:chromosome segregation ATPase